MKRKTYILASLILAAFFGSVVVWNLSANTASAQKSDDLGVITGVSEYNPRDEFALTQGGANGLWNYGYSTSDADNTLNLFNEATDADTISSGCTSPFQRWRIANAETIPQIARHNPAVTCANIPSNALFIHPGKNNQRAVLRFNAPVSGTFQITGTFQKQALSATSDLKIIKNAALPGETVLYSGVIGAVYQQAFNFTATIAAGDKIDFSVGDDGDNTWQNDGASIAVTIGQPTAACTVAPANLQVNVPAENSPTDVQSVNTNASLVGDATYTNTGKVSRAFEFDGSGDYVRIEDNAAQRPATAVTAEGWFKFDAVGGVVSLISKPVRGSALNSYTLYLEGGQLRGLIGNASQFTRALSNFSPQTGVWHHLAFTYDLSGGVSTLKLYANGTDVTSSVDGTANLPLFYDANPFPLLIGGEFENNAPAFTLDGQADEVSIYGRALAQTEIFDIVQRGSFGKCSPGSACVSAPQGLVSFYKGEDNALDSNSLNPGALQNGTTFQSGQVGRAFNFDGVDDFVAVPDSNSLDITRDLTIEAWIRPTTNPAFSRIVSKRSLDDSNAEYDVLRQGDGRIRFSSINGGADNFVVSSGTVPPNVYTHVAVTIQGSTLQFYINGALDSTRSYNVARNATAGRLTIGAAEATGCGGSGVCSFFGGQIDEFSIYNRAVSASEVSAIYNAAGNGKCLAYTCAQPPNNLVSWFAGEQNALDAKSNNHGTLQNGATFATGKVGQGIKFDGVNDYVEIPDNANLKPATLTLETWVKFDSLSSTVTGGAPANYQNIIFKKNSRTAGTGFEGGYSLVKNPDNRIGIGFNSASGGTDFASSTTVVQAGVWYHIVGTHDGTNIKLYINGQLEGTGAATFPIDYGTTPLYLGNAQVPFSGYFNGVLDETSIYNRALTATEVSSIYNAGQSGKCKPVATNPAANQIAWVSGDGDTRDFLGFNPNGVLRGDTNFRVGKVGQAFNLDGSGDYIEVADDADHRPATQLTAEGWFKFNNFNNLPHLIAKGLRGNDRNSYVLWFANGNIRIGYSDSGSNFIFYDTGFAPNVGEFNHYALVLNTDDAGANANTLKLYVGGREVFSGAAAGSIYYDTVNPHPLTIGADINNDVPDFSLNGQADEVSLYSRALSASEIAAIYNAGTAGKLKSAVTPVNLPARAKTSAGFAPTTVQLSDATVTFAQVTSAGITSQNNIDLGLLPKLPEGAAFTGLAYDVSTTAVYQNGSADDVQVCFNIPALQNLTFANLRIYHLENGSWANRTQTGGGSPNLCTDNLTSLSPFVIVQVAPTSAPATVSGRVLDQNGSGVSRVTIILSDLQGNRRQVLTSSFGYYDFEAEVGQTYILTAKSKQYTFAPPTQVVNVNENVSEINFTAQTVDSIFEFSDNDKNPEKRE